MLLHFFDIYIICTFWFAFNASMEGCNAQPFLFLYTTCPCYIYIYIRTSMKKVAGHVLTNTNFSPTKTLAIHTVQKHTHSL